MPGPIPKRSDERRRENKPEGVQVAKVPAGKVVEPPDADPSWHPIALGWFESLKDSGQERFYQASDWATARYVAEAMSRNLNQGGKFSSMLFSAVMGSMTELLTTEGARRRARVELERVEDVPEPASLHIMDKYRKAVSMPEGG